MTAWGQSWVEGTKGGGTGWEGEWEGKGSGGAGWAGEDWGGKGWEGGSWDGKGARPSPTWSPFSWEMGWVGKGAYPSQMWGGALTIGADNTQKGSKKTIQPVEGQG